MTNLFNKITDLYSLMYILNNITHFFNWILLIEYLKIFLVFFFVLHKSLYSLLMTKQVEWNNHNQTNILIERL